jgi:tetratricopeptide (TPR) repeat protein
MIKAENTELWHSAPQLAAEQRLRLARLYAHDAKRLDYEFQNIRTARLFLVGEGISSDRSGTDIYNPQLLRVVIDFAEVLAPYLHQRGLDAELEHWCDDALTACKLLRHKPGPLLLLRAEAQFTLGKWDNALSNVNDAISLTACEDPTTYARAMLTLGRFQLNRGHYSEALPTLAKAEQLLEEQSDHEGWASARAELAAYHLNRRNLDMALSLYISLEMDESTSGQPNKEGQFAITDQVAILSKFSDRGLLMLGVVYRKRREYRKAKACLQTLLKRGTIENNRALIATTSHHLAWLYLELKDILQAKRLCGQAHIIYQEIGDTRGLSDSHEQLGLIALAEGDCKVAIVQLKRSLTMRRQLGNQQGAASSLRRLAVAYFLRRRPLYGIRSLLQSLILYHRIGALTPQQLCNILQEVVLLLIRKLPDNTSRQE